MRFEDFPREFDVDIYRQYTDLTFLSDQDALKHFENFGRMENRLHSEVRSRNDLIDMVGRYGTVLEIGPFDQPVIKERSSIDDRLRPAEIYYADWLSKDDLVQRAHGLEDRNPNGIPDIHYVLSKVPLRDIDRRFDCIVSSHCIEHQPDLIGHLLDVSSMLKEGGTYVCLLPDKRFCFDAFIPVTELPELIAAHLEGRKKPSLRSIIEHRAFTDHDFHKDGAPNPFEQSTPHMREKINGAFAEFKSHDYVDVHCWYFTDKSLKSLLKSLTALRFLPEKTKFRVYALGGELGMVISF